MNIVFFVLVLAAVVCAGGTDIVAAVSGAEPTKMAAVGTAAFDGAKASVTLAITLAGAMTLFLGLMKVVEAAGGLDALARLIRPVLVRLFPDVPPTHPAMGAIVMNIGANVLGLGNAATPFGIKAMQELETLNKHPGTATNAMVLFLAINTSGVAVLPTGVMAMRAAAGSAAPESIFVPTLVASVFNTVVAVLAAKGFSRLFPAPSPPDVHAVKESWLDLIPLVAIAAGFATLVVTVFFVKPASAWIIPMLILGMLTIGVVRRVKVYEVFIEGAKDGFASATRIIPYLVAILTAVGMLRASGALDAAVAFVAPAVRLVGMPPEVLPLALLRPLSGSGAYALTTEITTTYGPDTFIAQVAGTMQGTTETTFYVLAVYFGAVNILKTRHAVPTGLASDISGVLAAVAACHWLIS
ncbi:MAG: nucleoside recognition domain-containing protein [Myxococcota bacterium]